MSELPILVAYEEILSWLLEKTRTFPKHWRHSLTNRIESTALDVLEALVDARYEKGRKPSLRRASRSLDKLRVLVRLAYREHCLANAAYEHFSRKLDEIGRMLGGWKRARETPHETRQAAL